MRSGYFHESFFLFNDSSGNVMLKSALLPFVLCRRLQKSKIKQVRVAIIRRLSSAFPNYGRFGAFAKNGTSTPSCQLSTDRTRWHIPFPGLAKDGQIAAIIIVFLYFLANECIKWRALVRSGLHFLYPSSDAINHAFRQCHSPSLS